MFVLTRQGTGVQRQASPDPARLGCRKLTKTRATTTCIPAKEADRYFPYPYGTLTFTCEASEESKMRPCLSRTGVTTRLKLPPVGQARLNGMSFRGSLKQSA